MYQFWITGVQIILALKDNSALAGKTKETMSSDLLIKENEPEVSLNNGGVIKENEPELSPNKRSIIKENEAKSKHSKRSLAKEKEPAIRFNKRSLSRDNTYTFKPSENLKKKGESLDKEEEAKTIGTSKTPLSNNPIDLSSRDMVEVTSGPDKKIAEIASRNDLDKKTESKKITSSSLSDLLFKSSVITKDGILTKEHSEQLLESNKKLKGIISQLSKIIDNQETILNKFVENKLDEQGKKNVPQDVMNLKLIEVTEAKKE